MRRLLLALTLAVAAPNPAQAIGSGELVGADEPAARSAVILREGKKFLCTGTLIAPDLVLTAGHCVSSFTAGNVGLRRPRAFRVYFGGYNGRTWAHQLTYEVRAIRRHPKFAEALEPDLALVQIRGAAPTPYVPMPLLRDSSLLPPRGKLTLAGFGRLYGHGDPREPKQRLLYRFTTVLRKARGTTLQLYKSKELPWVRAQFRAADAAEQARLDMAGMLSGDSGGPALREFNGATFLAGVAAGYDDSDYPFYTSVTAELAWIDATAAELGSPLAL